METLMVKSPKARDKIPYHVKNKIPSIINKTRYVIIDIR